MPDTPETSGTSAPAPLTVLWFRDDLRVTDHPALVAAREAGAVVGLWIREERDAEGRGPRPLGGAARWWAHRSLEALAAGLDGLGIPLLFAAGPAARVLPAVAEGLGATAVRWSRRYAPASRALDEALKDALRGAGLEVHSHPGSLLVEPWEVATGSGSHYRVFTPFWKAAAELPVGAPLAAPAQQDPDRDAPGLGGRITELEEAGVVLPLAGLGLLDGTGTGSGATAAADTPRWWEETIARHWEPGCAAAEAALDEVAGTVDGYADGRDRPADEHGTSRLSPRLRFGELSPRQLVHAVTTDPRTAAPDHEGRRAWVRQLYWREFSWHLTYHCPPLEREPLRPEFRSFPWEPDDGALRAWQRGRTGVPLVDAGLRQLWQSGWMHNRVRLVVGSFLAKNLLHPWWDGEQWFWDTLVDADEANNPVSWQWVAGCGADAAPYFRVFNPETQRERFDPDGAYVRRWLPEALEPLSGYPEPIVDLKQSRRHALDAYEEMKATAS
ncbi:deoxyribodipyrimidine photo-lyase [Citricoccus sp. SGAir0253]|uniref:cryptochrome/photolyase family protein n=1 Tax=Citricoccus sp. SGAir0253 TaxID=2567881 RepID=UPI0010CD3162|nr:deoxyribodipyrimidine photo-lyase [Citricoccus sp. SGAir0253]QCU78204.1 deoxyribodipyrimidine photo-lyase [Citricoccus sp. SGAir0253]